jgi:negative regulator of flagellin synthesis FlgM
MRINGPNNLASMDRTQATSAVSGAASQAGSPAKAAEARPSSSRESVEVSRASQMLASSRAAETPDPERIARLRAALADGSFNVDSKAIADAMLREER